MSMFYTYPSLFTTITLIFLVTILVVCHWLVKKCAPICLCNLLFIIIYYKRKLKGKKFKNQDVCPSDGIDLEAKKAIEISGQIFPAGLNIDYSNLVIREEIGEGNFGKVYQGYLQLNDVQR